MRLGIAAMVMLCSAAQAAEITRVASSFEPTDPFGMNLDIMMDRTHTSGKIVREFHQNGILDSVSELRYKLFETQLPLAIHIGVFRDLEINVAVPIVFQQDRYWVFAQGTNDTNTTIYRNCGTARGDGCTAPGNGVGKLFDVGTPSSSFRSGLGNFTFGFAWAAYNQKKDDSKPTWVIRFNYTAPTAPLLNPSIATDATMRGNIGDRVHRLSFATAVSKKLGIVEPYFNIAYTLPIPGSDIYTNCDNASDDRMARKENCGLAGWSRAETGLHPQHTGGFTFGSELNVFERIDKFQRFAFDARVHLNYFSEGRVYNELSDLMGKLLYTSDYAQIGGYLGFVGQAAEFFTLRAGVGFSYNTDHYLTNETIGQDLDNSGGVEITDAPQEINPVYDFRVDHPGRRFRIEEQLILNIQVSASLNF